MGIRAGGNDALDRNPIAADLLDQVPDDRRGRYDRERRTFAIPIVVTPAGDGDECRSHEQCDDCGAKSLEVRQSHRALPC